MSELTPNQLILIKMPDTFSKNYKVIFLTSLLAGTLDILAALLPSSNPGKILQFIASAVLGADLFSGGFGTIILGLLLHFIIAFIWTLLFFMIYPRIKILFKGPWTAGITYGIFIWLVMNLLILPLSRAPEIPFNIGKAAIAMGILIALVGIPISLIAYKYDHHK
ncbi:hypothetical protein SAMN04515674_102317 [Pseudarcicella hirudinis]|uniref:DUF1440 domain-containing protein n=1 Tax=Pseudarcicella hirudinis TaxID=1079859 RepID=A0A1I5P6T7_9BACT|nr:DUF1440 domain-containing protein [Pseudarcicella hirudinis]SFP29818.1 hypothetical protein SAMN04515674_102317 [Pseudarcicella hirudinis]